MDNRREAHMRHQRESGVKAKVVVTLRESAEENTVVLYRGGRNGLAFRSPSHRLLKDAARLRSREEGAFVGAQASAAVTFQQGGY